MTVNYSSENLLVRPEGVPGDPGLIVRVTPERAGWRYISFEARRLADGESWSFATGTNELAFVNLSGTYGVESDRGQWSPIGGRANVFESAAHALYLPRDTKFTVTALQGGEFAVAWVPAEEDHPARLIRPEEVTVSVRGGDHASRQINDLLPPGSDVQRLVLVEVYTPGGNWSSYPPHKHDVHIPDEGGGLTEADLEEVYFYKFDRPDGYALQRVYTESRSPMAVAGCGFDCTLAPTENCAVLVPEGHHPVSSPPGYMTYYLNVLAGSAQSLANQDDPRYTWVKHTYKTLDHRVPIY